MGSRGMKGVDTIARIRREFSIRGKTIKEIARELHVSRNTVRKVLRSGATSFEYARKVQPQPKIGTWRPELDRLLMANDGRPARERLTLIRLFEDLRDLGYEGKYDAVLRAELRHRHDEPRLRRVAVRLRRRQDDHRAPRPAYPPLRHRRDRQRELALQEQALSSPHTADPEPARLRNPHQLRRAASSPRNILKGSTLDADRGATLRAV